MRNMYRCAIDFDSTLRAAMFLRSILFPSIVACAIGVPIVYSTEGQKTPPANQYPRTLQSPFEDNSTMRTGPVNSVPVYTHNAPVNRMNTIATSGSGVIVQNPAASLRSPQFGSATTQPIVATNGGIPRGNMQLPSATSLPNGIVVSSPGVIDPSLTRLTPDFGAAETFVFPGDANGPDLTAEPTDFIPVSNLAEIIRFDVFPNWVKSRWKRISTNPGESGLHGLRVALVTGTNTWDLHGSLTYYFDVNQRAQRITFRGWTGDSSRLVNLLTSQFGLKAQPTHWAGAYAAQTKRGVPNAGLLMQHPAIITRENPVQQVALVMELNHPEGSFQLSNEFMNMLRYAVQTR